MTLAEKKRQLKKHKKCYVCEALGLRNADFTTSDMDEINFDHWKPKRLIGSDQANLFENQVPIHAHPGATYKDEDFQNAVQEIVNKGIAAGLNRRMNRLLP